MGKKERQELMRGDEDGGVAGPPPPAPSLLAARELADVEMSLGSFRFHARTEMSPAGLLAIGGMVGAILLSTAVVVRAARR